MQTIDVIIVGGGMVGASLALALARSGMQAALVEQQTLQPGSFSMEDPWQPRVSALTEASIKLLNYLDAWEGIVAQRACPYTHMTVWDGEGTGEVEFDAKTLPQKNLGYIVENDVIRNALLQQLASSTVQCFDQQTTLEYKLSGQGGEIVLKNGDVLGAPLLVAADGGESRLRQLSGIPANQKDYKHHALVTTVETERFHHHTARQVFLDSGPLAFLPLQSQGERHYCSIVWSLLPAEADRIEALSDDAFCQELARAFEHRAGNILKVDQRFRYPLRQRHARQYHRQGVVLVGDAAHTIHPLAGQGVNLGFMDVAVLADELIKAAGRGDDYFAAHVLDRYQRRRIGHNSLTMAAMTGFQNLFGANALGIRWIRNTGLSLTNRLPFIKDMIVDQASGLSKDIPGFLQ
ncbi:MULTISPECIES: FAD-dependent oxidoreductase [Gammaproteobacteria]|uniref:FAD-dependent oxidoreductase n=1 Tax=Gammaproteobacteria TaxID=1236 RepID=UPI001ADB8962|nr:MULTISPECIES: FAD-dependent oxidoreductase [Gammaproteobacteria]MBO9480864.1 FAD-dependent monooxygenase [Salinisphaera sp. G21_0]MBO9495210.1 FAD-dependent monooxygenase [Thalassotalea sp. G20_0]